MVGDGGQASPAGRRRAMTRPRALPVPPHTTATASSVNAIMMRPPMLSQKIQRRKLSSGVSITKPRNDDGFVRAVLQCHAWIQYGFDCCTCATGYHVAIHHTAM